MQFDEMATASYMMEKQFIFLRLTVLREVGQNPVPWDCVRLVCYISSVLVSGKRT